MATNPKFTLRLQKALYQPSKGKPLKKTPDPELSPLSYTPISHVPPPAPFTPASVPSSFTSYAAPSIYHVPTIAQLPAQPPIPLLAWPIGGTFIDTDMEEDTKEQEECPSSRASFDSL
jgi:hypothetical protein